MCDVVRTPTGIATYVAKLRELQMAVYPSFLLEAAPETEMTKSDLTEADLAAHGLFPVDGPAPVGDAALVIGA